MIGKHAVVLTLTAVAGAVTAVVAWAGPQYSGWAQAAPVDQVDATGVNTRPKTAVLSSRRTGSTSTSRRTGRAAPGSISGSPDEEPPRSPGATPSI